MLIKHGSRAGIQRRIIARILHEDLKIRGYVKDSLKFAGVSKVEIERAVNRIKVNVYTARPGVVIGKKGQGIETLRATFRKYTKNEVVLNIIEVKRPEVDAPACR